jgi:hypothetical protein
MFRESERMAADADLLATALELDVAPPTTSRAEARQET